MLCIFINIWWILTVWKKTVFFLAVMTNRGYFTANRWRGRTEMGSCSPNSPRSRTELNQNFLSFTPCFQLGRKPLLASSRKHRFREIQNWIAIQLLALPFLVLGKLLNRLNLSFLIFKLGIITPLLQCYCEN